MTKAKLIKRTASQNECAAPLPSGRPRSPVFHRDIPRSTLAVAREWVRQQQTTQPPNPRAAFAALFAQTATTN